MSSPASYSSTCIFPAKDPGLASKRAPARAGDELINAGQLHRLLPASLSEFLFLFPFISTRQSEEPGNSSLYHVLMCLLVEMSWSFRRE